ncbi:RagB/SusD family nutrient uptake outer membrane protein [Chitinophaga pollutisoli]|uniref:RagB/SusD family nutrient uptake outer membrane protein n=1 Tax=Chitinophaga pollutisoli TaxID=3133966 RepID=A0ABZ2YR32_9BACT
MKRFSIYACLLAMLAVVPGCRKYLYEAPINNSYDEIFWVNEKAADQSVAGAYHLLREAVRNENAFFTFSELAADIYTNGEWNYASLIRGGSFRFGYAPYLEGSLWDWSRYYDVIAQANLALEKIPTIPESGWEDISRRDKLRGEAFFIRAYTYFQVLRTWGEPVIRLKPLQESELDNPPSIARSTDAEAIKVIRQDIDSALQYLDDIHPEGVVRAGKYAAYALKAHVAAWAHDYATALTAADAVIGSNEFRLAENAAELKKLWDGGSSESIFELPMLFNPTFDESSGFFNSILQEPITKGSNGGNKLILARVVKMTPEVDFYKDMAPLFPDTTSDLRFRDLIFRDYVFKVNPNDITDTTWTPNKFILTKYSNVSWRDPKNEVGLYANNNLVLFRLADIVLLKAEALANLNREAEALTTAYTVADLRKGRHYDPAIDASVKDYLLDERHRELLGEGASFFDLIRTGLLTERISIYKGERWEQKGYYWPINMRALKPNNDKLTQNYYWATH